MPGWVVRTHPPMTKLVFWKLLENRVFLWERYSVIFVKDVYPLLLISYGLAGCLWLIAYLSESLLRAFIYELESMASLC